MKRVGKRAGIFLVIILLFSMAAAPAAFAGETGNSPEYDGYIVKLKDDYGLSAGLFSAEGPEASSPGHGLYLSEGGIELKRLVDSGLVEYIEPNYKVRLMGSVNDPYYPQQWNLVDIGVDDAWDYGLDGAGVRIAVIDSGLNVTHEDFAGSNILTGVNMLAGSSDVTDVTGHGTFVSGVIAATSDNGIGIAGITDKVELIPIKCFHDSDQTNVMYIISAIYKAVDEYKCDVVNLSLGLKEDLQSFREAIDHADAEGVIVISSVGNEGKNTLLYPAAYDNVVGVGSVGKNGEVCSFSQYNTSVFVTAPGEGLYSLGHSQNNSYMTGSGTSFSTPHVSAMAIMAKCYDKSIGIDEFKELLIESSRDRGDPGYDIYFGYGYVEVDTFIQALVAPRVSQSGANASANAVIGSTIDVDMSGWFTGEDNTFSIYADTASGSITIVGSTLSYTPASEDVGKSVRIIVSVISQDMVSDGKAVLTVSVTDPGVSSSSADIFSDMSGHWAKQYVSFGVDMGLLNGVSANIFDPDGVVNRAMFTTALARLSGEDYSETDTGFSDVSSEDWFAGAVRWAAEGGLVTGYGNGAFGPLDSITREQLVTLMYKYAMSYRLSDGGYDSNTLYGFTDYGSTSSWAKDAMGWAVANALISGRTSTTLAPSGTATRAEIAGILQRFYNSFY